MKKTAILVAALILIPALTLGSVLFLLHRAETPEEESTVVEVSEEESSAPAVAASEDPGEGSVEEPYVTPDEYFEFVREGDYAYMIQVKDATALTGRVVIPAEHEGKPVAVISPGGFADCVGMTDLVIPENVTVLFQESFKNCSSLKRVSLPATLKEIGYSAFENCVSLETVTVPENVTAIAHRAFDGCEKLKTLNITTDELVTAQASAFTGCNALEYAEYGNCLYLGDAANPYRLLVKAKNEAVAQVSVNASAVAVAAFAFSGCASLTELELPEGVKTIDMFAFNACSGLRSVGIPQTVINFRPSAFSGCASLADIRYAGTAEQWSALANGFTGDFAVYCSDGVIMPDGG
ncbi:MAG: leucine-rich repeat domain-containing protein [Clostridia bacterium]|nr:leucine-rich repeat domain-containing protein [Clostridia bacterium]